MPLDTLGEGDESLAGGKAATTARLARAGFEVPRGFVLTTEAYQAFVKSARLGPAIRVELGRKPMGDMRWEEIWDTALRIRSLFHAYPMPDDVRDAIAAGLSALGPNVSVAVRSSAVGEDSADRSFAGLHDSVVGVRGERELEDAVRRVWASLWSDAALLYRQELGLDPARSHMAVLVQAVVEADRSGVGFAVDPRDAATGNAIVEAVAGPCSLLVDGVVDPHRWEIDRTTRRIVAWRAGRDDAVPLLEPDDLGTIVDTLVDLERLFGWSPDMEWTGRSGALTVLQARPITTAPAPADDKRDWYLTLRPGDARLRALRERVAGQLIPALEAEGEALAEEDLATLDDRALGRAIVERRERVAHWKVVYWDEFIPFAHGVRRLATYYNDAVRPDDPYEFVGLLRNQPLLAAQRNDAIHAVSRMLVSDGALRDAIGDWLDREADTLSWPAFRAELARLPGAPAFLSKLDELGERHLDIVFDGVRMRDQPEPFLRNLLELARPGAGVPDKVVADSAATLETRLLDAVGAERRDEALEMLEIGRVSWRLRDDDNLLVARLESQLLRALGLAGARLRTRGRLSGDGAVDESYANRIVHALGAAQAQPIVIEARASSHAPETSAAPPGETPRQLIGQPASPGLATGTVRCILDRSDLGEFRRGDVLVCDAIQPTITHLVPLASAIVERRGGMLIHGAIIARELGIPCVNGVRDATGLLRDADVVTVDGYLGIVTVGPPEFDLEFGGESG
jgi:pyruvate,water dikinase